MGRLMHGANNGSLQLKVQATHCHVPSAFTKGNPLVIFSHSQLSPSMQSQSALCAKRTLNSLMRIEAIEVKLAG
jgi:hypothetical protein